MQNKRRINSTRNFNASLDTFETNEGEEKLSEKFLSVVVIVIIIESRLIIRLSAALVSVGRQESKRLAGVDFSNPWHAGRYGVIVAQRRPLLFPPSFPRQRIYSRAGREGLRGAF